MKVAVECKSPLMQKSLEMFLQNHLSTLKQCDIVIRDEHEAEKLKHLSVYTIEEFHNLRKRRVLP